MVNALKELSLLLETMYIDPESILYKNQKEKLTEGIFIIPQVIYTGLDYRYSNEILSDSQKNIRYVLNKVIKIQNQPRIRGFLSKPLFFSDDFLEFSLIYGNQTINSITTLAQTVVQEKQSISFEKLIETLNPQYYNLKLNKCSIKISLITGGFLRNQAEEYDYIFEPNKYSILLQRLIIDSLHYLYVHNQELYLERLKLWETHSNDLSLPCLCQTDFGIKDIIVLAIVQYNFKKNLSNQELLESGNLIQSYIKKINLLIQLFNEENPFFESKI